MHVFVFVYAVESKERRTQKLCEINDLNLEMRSKWKKKNAISVLSSSSDLSRTHKVRSQLCLNQAPNTGRIRTNGFSRSFISRKWNKNGIRPSHHQGLWVCCARHSCYPFVRRTVNVEVHSFIFNKLIPKNRHSSLLIRCVSVQCVLILCRYALGSVWVFVNMGAENSSLSCISYAYTTLSTHQYI